MGNATSLATVEVPRHPVQLGCQRNGIYFLQ